MKTATPRIGIVGTLWASVLILITALLLMAASPVQAQEVRLARLAEPARGQVEALVAAARQRGLPTEPLIDRALEGTAKGAPANLIVAAVTRLRDELLSTRGVLGEAASGAELTAGASALRAGATVDDLARLRALRLRQPLTVAAGVLADLVAAGVPADTAIGAVLTLAGGADDADFLAFRRNVQRDIALGASPAAALDVRLRGLTEAADSPLSQGGQNRQKRKP